MALKGLFTRKTALVEAVQLIRLASCNLHSSSIFQFSPLHPNVAGRPKQPINAFLIFMQEQRLAVQPDDYREFMRAAGTRWRELTEAQKEPFVLKQKQLQEKYRADLASYKALISKEEKQAFLDDFRENKKKRQKRMLKKEIRETNPPNRNRSALSFYLTSRFSSARVESLEDGGKLMKEVTNSWKALSDSEKQPFDDQALQDKKRYHMEMQEYVQRMREEEKVHLLPIKYQKQAAGNERKSPKGKAS